ncbi:MAG TPA: Tad domain-containing protein [Dehalococcoidia bacterium]|nr:Tad domain-containing protein [Dehalococcoidia bacterium]
MNRSNPALRRRGWLHRGEEGQALVLWVLCLTVIIGMTGLVLDGSNLQNNRRHLQNAADAAAFAGAYRLPQDPTAATTEDLQWLTANGSSGGEVTTNVVSQTYVPNDTITVSLTRTVGYSFMRVLGLTSGSVGARAVVVVGTITQGAVGCGGFVPYAIWFENKDGTPLAVGDVVVFRSNAWVQKSVQAVPGPDWTGTSKDFKGFFRTGSNFVSGCGSSNPFVADGDILTKGGDACGSVTDPTKEAYWINLINQAYINQTPIIVTVLNYESGNGNVNVTVETFAALNVNISQNAGTLPINPPNACSKDIYGQITQLSTTLAGFNTGTGTPPPPGGSCGTGIGVCMPKLIQ